MKKSIQTTLSPTDRAAQMAMDAVLTPFEKVFAFLEDTMTIKVGYALAAGRHGQPVASRTSAAGTTRSTMVIQGEACELGLAL